MKISVLTIFPQMFDSFRSSPVVARVVDKGAVDLDIVDIKDYSDGSFRRIDDSPCGGGPGMVMRVEPIARAIRSVASDSRDSGTKVVLLSPKGRTFNQKIAHEYASLDHLVLVCGHYEGVDARVLDYIDEQISIGDYILTGGELGSQVICDSVIRLQKGALRDQSTVDESFENGLLEYPQYTHPVEYEGKKVPDVLLCGNQTQIARWRNINALYDTAYCRPDLLECLDKDGIGRSGSGVYFLDDVVLKVQKSSDFSRREIAVCKWLNDGQKTQIKAPEMLFDFEKDGKSYLCMDRIKGKMLCDPTIMRNQNRLMKSMAAALRMLWEIDISDCPFDSRTDRKLERARFNIEHGLADFTGSEEFSSSEKLYEWLVANKPEEDLVFSHGDMCLPNFFCNCDGLTGMIDLGLAGVGDRWCDIAIAYRSMRDNTEGRFGNRYGDFDADRFFEILGIKPDWEKIRYYLLLDELF